MSFRWQHPRKGFGTITISIGFSHPIVSYLKLKQGVLKMKKEIFSKSLVLSVALTGLATSIQSPSHAESSSLFHLREISPPLIAAEEPAAKCGSGSCGSAPKKDQTDHKCGSGSCGSAPKKDQTDHKCGSGSCGSSSKPATGTQTSPGPKDTEHKCGTQSCATKH